MSPSPPFELVVGALVAGVVATILAIASMVAQYVVLQGQLEVLANISRIRSNLRQLSELRQLDGASLAQLADQDRTITEYVNEGMRRLERELRLHTGSNLLHPGGAPDVT